VLDHLVLFFVSLISNIFSAFSGGGAGVIQLPAILLLYDIAFINALATHKIATVALGVGATSKFKTVIAFDYKLICKLLLFGIPGVILGAEAIVITDENIARTSLGVFIVCIAIYSLYQKNHGENMKKTNNSNQIFLGYFFAFITGLLNGSLSAGTGLIFTMSLITFFGLDYKNAIAYTLIIVGFFYNAMGAIILSFNTDLYLILLPSLIFGSLIGGYIGAKISLKKSNKSIRRIYQLITITVGISLII
tara:strand:+ start:3533 stop:4279 length:747 start_codon:yes stop_codon:yes gene_type:complete